MKTSASLFTGGGGADIGLAAAGFSHLWGIEREPDIAAVATSNGFATICQDVQTVDFASLEAPYWLHMSPPCPSFSQAKTGREETELDIALAGACVRAIATLRPPYASLENVWGYREAESFRGSTREGDRFNFEGIVPALKRLGYSVAYWHLNAADVGVPQTRKRLILVASRVAQPVKPFPTHAKRPDMFTLPWRGWHESIEDLLPSLPPTQPAPWQLERLPEELKALAAMVSSHNTGQERGKRHRLVSEPMHTVTVLIRPSHLPKALLIGGGNTNKTKPDSKRGLESEPAFTVTAGSKGNALSNTRALLLGQDTKLTVRSGDLPAMTLLASPRTYYVRAFIMEGSAAGADNKFTMPVRMGNEPVFTMRARQNNPRAYLPAGRWVSMTPRALARFQTVPDWYELPDKVTLACKIIGNAVPPLLMEAVARAQGETHDGTGGEGLRLPYGGR